MKRKVSELKTGMEGKEWTVGWKVDGVWKWKSGGMNGTEEEEAGKLRLEGEYIVKMEM